MYRHFHCHPIIFLVLFNYYCYATPIQFVNHNRIQEAIPLMNLQEQDLPDSSDIINANDQIFYFNMLCTLYNYCYDRDQQSFVSNDMKPKRVMSNLFHGIPKFGKRALSSAFSGIPKFG